jgi:phytoene/squalene synthetase
MILAAVLGVTRSDAAPRIIAAGAATRLASIVRSLSSDVPVGRLYLPIEDLAKQRLPERKLLKREADVEKVAAIVRLQVTRARELLNRGGDALPWIAPDGSRAAAGLLIAFTAASLDDIERAGADVLHRPPRTSALRVVRRVGDAWRMARMR